jgi:hypothetical protein
MPAQKPLPLQYSDESPANSSCVHCGAVVRHDPWCITQNANVSYAYQIVVYPNLLSVGDQLILHALGVTWKELEPKRRSKFFGRVR